MMLRSAVVLLIHLSCFSMLYAGESAVTVDDLWAMHRIGSTALSPDGEWIAYDLKSYDMEANSGSTQVWRVPAGGGEAEQLTWTGTNNSAPQWRPDNSALTFLSRRSGTSQLYSLSSSGSEARQMTDLPVDIGQYLWSPDNRHIAFTADVYPEAGNLRQSAELQRERQGRARIADALMYRIWDSWRLGLRKHIFLLDTHTGSVRDLTPGPYDAPALDLNGERDFHFSPDGAELAFVSNHDPFVAISTNNDIFLVSIADGELKCITPENRAVDNQPLYSPDGRILAYRAMARPGFEADQYDIILYDRSTGERRNLTDDFDIDAGEMVWMAGSRSIIFTGQFQARNRLYRLDTRSEIISELLSEGSNSAPMAAPGGAKIYFKRNTIKQPDEIYCLEAGDVTPLTRVNRETLARIRMPDVEDFWYTSFDGQRVHGLLVRPPFFDADRTYPLVLLIHGGPQGMWQDRFHYRWNAAMFAAPGYLVAMINCRGSKGYGQSWCDAVSRDWGGGPYRDLMTGLDSLLASQPAVDAQRLVAAGASYGGFMVNWIATRTGRFRALVSHAGVFDQRSMYGATEELWFPEWEFGGTPYSSPELYEKWSPSTRAHNLSKYRTPTLVLHGEGDFRVPVGQGMQMFTALQRHGVPSRLVLFPDETHFISTPQNARLWWNEIYDWIEKWIQRDN